MPEPNKFIIKMSRRIENVVRDGELKPGQKNALKVAVLVICFNHAVDSSHKLFNDRIPG